MGEEIIVRKALDPVERGWFWIVIALLVLAGCMPSQSIPKPENHPLREHPVHLEPAPHIVGP